MKIGIIGTGYVGLIQALGLAKLGFNIIALDIDKEKIEKLSKGIPTIFEDGINELLSEVKNKIKFTVNYKDLNEVDVIFIAVGTPQDERGRTDKKYLYDAIKQIKENVNEGKIIVTKSTVPVGTNEEIKRILGNGFKVVSNPEFLREGRAISDFFNPDRIIVGFENGEFEDTKNRIRKIYEYFINKGVPYLETDIKTAELIKYASNAFLATKISFINELARLADKVGANIKDIALGMGLDKRIGKEFLNAGIGYGGSCFPKDVKSLIYQFKDNDLNPEIISATDKVNEEQIKYFFNKIVDYFKDLKNKKFLILGLTFKPYTDDLRESKGVEIARLLKQEGGYVYGYDILKEARDNTKKYYGSLIDVIDDLDNFDFSNVDGIIITTEYKEFNDLNLDKIKKENSKIAIFDGRNILNKEKIKNIGLYYEGIGV